MSSLSPEDRRVLQKSYREIDQNGDGRVSVAELYRATKRLGFNYSIDEVQEIMEELDENGDGYLNYDEYEKLIVNTMQQETDEMNAIRKVFQTMDVDGDGRVTRKEISKTLNLSKSEAEEFLDLADTNKDGVLSFDEFLQIYREVNG